MNHFIVDPFYSEVAAITLTAVALFVGVALITWAKRIGR